MIANMTTRSARSGAATRFRLPDPPPRDPDEVTSYIHVHLPGNSHHLFHWFGHPETTLVAADQWMTLTPRSREISLRRPDLMIAFDVDPEAYYESNGYIVSEQGKPPDFVLEVASPSTADIDIGPKRDDYAALGIPEYWRFDSTGEHHGQRLAGDQLIEGRYQSFPIRELADGSLEGFSPVLNLNLRWEDGQLGWYDPASGRHIPTFEAQRDRAEEQRVRAEGERARAESERARAERAEARVRELEAEMRRLRRPET